MGKLEFRLLTCITEVVPLYNPIALGAITVPTRGALSIITAISAGRFPVTARVGVEVLTDFDSSFRAVFDAVATSVGFTRELLALEFCPASVRLPVFPLSRPLSVSLAWDGITSCTGIRGKLIILPSGSTIIGKTSRGSKPLLSPGSVGSDTAGSVGAADSEPALGTTRSEDAEEAEVVEERGATGAVELDADAVGGVVVELVGVFEEGEVGPEGELEDIEAGITVFRGAVERGTAVMGADVALTMGDTPLEVELNVEVRDDVSGLVAGCSALLAPVVEGVIPSAVSPFRSAVNVPRIGENVVFRPFTRSVTIVSVVLVPSTGSGAMFAEIILIFAIST